MGIQRVYCVRVSFLVVLKLSDVSESPGDLVKQRFLGLPPRVYDSIDLR